MHRNSNGHVLHPQATCHTDGHSSILTTTTSMPEASSEKGRISPTFAQFAHLDGAVRKTRNRAYQKAVGPDGPGPDLGEGPGSPDSHHGHGRPSTPARSHKRKVRESEGTKSHKKKVAEHVQLVQVWREREQSLADAAEEGDEEGKHEDLDDDNDDYNEYDGGTITIAPGPPLVPRPQRHHNKQNEPTTPPRSQPPLPLSPHHPASLSDYDSDHQHFPPEIRTARELSKQKTVIYGYPISLLTSPTRNWMPILDKESLIHQGISEVMATCGLPNAVPMIARRLSWIGKGKAVHPRPQRNRLGKFTKQRERSGTDKIPAPPGPPASITPSSKDRASNPPNAAAVEEWSLEKEQRKLLGGIIDLGTVIDGIDRARANSPIKHSIVGRPDEFVDVDVPLEVLLAGTECIAFTDLGFYRIYVPEKNQPFPLREQQNKPSRLNWDLEASKVDVERDRRGGRQVPWSVTFLGYEWESVRMELLDADDAEEGESREWVTTMAGYRVVRGKEEVSHIHPSAVGSGKLLGEGHVAASSHPWGRDVIEPPPVGVYAEGEYEDVVRNWFPWAWELVKDLGGDGEDDDEEGGGGGGGGKGGRKGKRKAAIEAGRKVKNDIGGGGYGAVGGSGHGGGGIGGKSGGKGKTHWGGYMKEEAQEEQGSPVRKRDRVGSFRERGGGEKVPKRARH
ncbi:hypothetical protein BGX38DRAFT_1271413 [Terfezia claveryi]|nr:hypothetical protein BGX38DRAFT_1271413 [Terfezia claveryi]